jgi:DNA-directed RNA polymerase specialized sigma24 family protein
MAEEIAIVACARRSLLLAVNRHRLRREDLEDCYSQATLELISQARRGAVFADRLHIAHALELRFLSRTRDRRRALGGRSPMEAALERATSLAPAGEEGIEVVDLRACVETQVIARDDLRAIRRALRRLTRDQRAVLASQLAGEGCAGCCMRLGWSREKYRKVAQRARVRLRRSLAPGEVAVPFGAVPSEEIAGPAYGHLSRS